MGNDLGGVHRASFREIKHDKDYAALQRLAADPKAGVTPAARSADAPPGRRALRRCVDPGESTRPW